jgi:transcriptional regulator with XRE-family HTH domain
MEAVLGVPSSADLARHLGRRLRYLRAQLGVNQRELAARAGTPRTHLSRLENGKALPQVATLARLALSLGVGIAELVHGIPALKKEHLPQIDVRETRHP